MRILVLFMGILSFASGVPADALTAAPAGSTAIPAPTPWQAVSKAYLADDDTTVLRLLNQASDRGDPAADASLGLIYYNGMHGTPKDYLKSAVYFTRAVQRGYDVTKTRMQGGTPGAPGAPQTTYTTLDRWFAQQLQEGDQASTVESGSLRVAYDAASRETAKLVASLYLKLTDQQDRLTEFTQGARYADGIGVPKDLSQAAIWYASSAKQGYAPAEFNLAILYANGQGVPKDPAQAVGWYTRAADQGYAPAQHNLALMLAAGVGVSSPSPVRAVQLLDSAANQGYAPAAYMLGLMYANGRGVPEDDAAAVSWYSKAAQAGFPAAEYNLALAYSAGRGVSRDEALATLWYMRAAEVGFAPAEYNLAARSAYGHGAPKDPVQGYAWALLAKAAAPVGSEISRIADQLEQQIQRSLTPSQITQAQAKAAAQFLAHE